jgi:deaminated glutathione amidase
VTGTTVRVAAVQFTTGTDVDDNLAAHVRMVGAAADEGARLVVAPEFGNHLSVYDSAAHAWDVAVDIDGPYVAALAALAGDRGLWLAASATVRRDPASRRLTVATLLFGPDGTLVAEADKTVLMGAEADHLSPGDVPKRPVPTPLGPLGLYCCMEGVIHEPARALAVGGARILCNSLNSFALDEASLHVPARAAENRCFVVAANKVGPLAPPERLAALASALHIDPTQLHGAGESQVVAPDGTVLAIGPRSGEAVVVADIDPDAAPGPRPHRRPELYRRLAESPAGRDGHPAADDLVASLDPATTGAELVVLAEDAPLPTDVPPGQVVVGAVRDGDRLVGIVVGPGGEPLLRQPLLHRSDRLAWATALGDGLRTVDLPWGRLAVLVGDDHRHPEATRLAALASADVVAVVTRDLEPWERTVGFASRAAENRVNLAVGATNGGLLVELPTDFTLWTPWERPFDGRINDPTVHTGPTAVLRPSAAANRLVSRGTDVVDGRPWRLLDVLVEA